MRTFGVGLLIVAAALVSACAPRQPAMVAGDGLKQDPQVVHGVLENGFQYFLLANQTPKDRVIVHLNIFAGSAHETDDEQGVAHYLEHLLFNGSEHFKPGELVAYFQSIGMDFGGDANAHTSFFKTVYDLNLPKGSRDYLEKGLLVIQDYAKGALLLEEEVAREKGIILAEKRERDSASYRTFKKSLAFELPNSLLTRRFPIGTTQVISSADRALLKGFYDRWYRPDNMALVMVGDFDVEMTKQMIQERFSQFKPRPAKPMVEPDISWIPHKGKKYFYHHEPESGSTTLTIERIDSVPFEGETESALKQRVLDDVADAVFQYRLDTLVRGESAGFTSASAYSGQFLRQLSVAAVTADCPPAKWRVGLTQLQKTLDQMLIFGAEARELNRVKADFLNELESAVKKADTRKSSNLARALLYSLNQKTVFQSPSQRYALLRPYIQDLTLDEVNAAFRRNWESDHRLVMVTGNLDLSGDAMSPVELIQDAHEAALAQEIAPYAQLEEKAFPYLQLPPVRFKVKKMEADVAGLGVTTLDFENNIRVNLKQTQFKKDEFLFKVVFGKGQASEPSDMPGLYLLAQSVIGNSGLGEMTPDQLDDALAGRDVGIGFGVGENYFSLSGAASPEEAELVYQLIYAHLMDPGFRENGLRLAQKRYRQQYESMVRTPDGVMAIQGKQFLSRGDLRFGYPDPARLDGIGLGDIKDWLVPQFKKAPLEISIVGDFDMEKMISITKAHVGAMEKRERAIPRTAYSPKKVGFPKGDRREFSLDSRIQKGMVQMVFKTDDFWDIKRTRRLSVLSQLVSERLRKVIREKLGATYSPYVYNDPALIYKGYGTFHMVVNIKPGNQDLVLESMEEILGNLRDGGISPSEVDLILKPIMTHLKELRQQNSYWLNSVMVNSRRHPQRFEWANGIMTDYAGIEAKDLDRLVKTYLKPGADAVVLIQPRVTTP